MKLYRILSALLVALFVLSPLNSERFYTVSETELTAIQNDLTIALTSLNKSREELTKAQTELTTLRTELKTLSEELNRSQRESEIKIIMYTASAFLVGGCAGYFAGRLSR